MSIKHEEADKLFIVLARATTSGELSWSRQPSNYLRTRMTLRLNGLFVALYEGAEFALMDVVNRSYDAEEDEYFFTEGVELALLDDEQRISYTFPYTDSINDLLNAVKAQTSGAQDVVRRILNASDKKKK